MLCPSENTSLFNFNDIIALDLIKIDLSFQQYTFFNCKSNCSNLSHGLGILENDFSEPCGEPIPSTDPWPERNESGGGVHMPCHYII